MRQTQLRQITLFSSSFNPRICKRCDEINKLFGGLSSGFNPRICKRCDTINCLNPTADGVSIHASVKDATENYDMRLARHGFNPRICKRCDSLAHVRLPVQTWFQSTHL